MITKSNYNFGGGSVDECKNKIHDADNGVYHLRIDFNLYVQIYMLRWTKLTALLQINVLM